MSWHELAYDLERRVAALPPAEKPVAAWFMDIDGVINVIGKAPSDAWPRYEHRVVHAFDGVAWPICFSPLFVSLLNQLHEKRIVSFRWLTTWEHDGPGRFAPAVGLTIGSWVAAEDLGDSPTWWKLDAFGEALIEVGELLIWTDDDIKHYHAAKQATSFLNPKRAAVICPDERKGLTPEEFEIILHAIENALAVR